MAEKGRTEANCDLGKINQIANEVGERREDENGNSNIGDVNVNFKDFKNAIDCHERDLKISREVGDRAGEERAYGNFGNACESLGDPQKATEYHERHLNTLKEVGETAEEGRAYGLSLIHI